MRAALLIVSVVATVSASAAALESAVATTPQAISDELLSVDRAFSATAAKGGAASTFASMMDDDVVMFIVPQPDLARGKAQALTLIGRAFDASSTLSWQPIRAGISSDGTHGFTYGFATKSEASKPTTLAKYVSYWVKRPAGWRVAAFKFVPRADGVVDTRVRPAILPDAIVEPGSNASVVEKYRAEVDKVERDFSDESQLIGLGPAFRKYGSSDAVNVGGSADFTYGNEAIGAGFGDDKGSPLRWAPDGVIVASSGDLGITYGYLQRNGEVPPGRLAKIPWFTVWRRVSPQVPWRYIAE